MSFYTSPDGAVVLLSQVQAVDALIGNRFAVVMIGERVIFVCKTEYDAEMERKNFINRWTEFLEKDYSEGH